MQELQNPSKCKSMNFDKNKKAAYSEIMKLRNEFYQKWQDAPQYDDNKGAYKAKYEAFDKALELLTPSIMDSQPEESIEYNPFDDFRHTDSEESVSENLLDEIHNRWEDDPHTKWPKCPYKDFKNIACHFANWQKQQMMKNVIEREVKVDAGGYPYISCDIEFYDYDNDKPLAKKGDMVKLIVLD